MFATAVAEWGLQPSEFWDMTPCEFWLIAEAKAPDDGALTVDEFDELAGELEA